MNRATILGRVGADPEIRSFQSGDKVANLRIATSERWKDKETGERKEKTEWHSVAVFGPVVGVVEQYVHKGDQILIEGKIETRKWQDQSGQDRYSTEIVVRGNGGNVHLIGGKRDDNEAPRQGHAPRNNPPPATRNDLDDEVPF